MAADVFLAFDENDVAFAGEIEGLLMHGEGFGVYSASGPKDDISGEELANASCVVVLWSRASVKSPWMRAVAARARDRQVLLAALIEDATPPGEFRQYCGHDLRGVSTEITWDERNAKPVYALVEDIRGLLGTSQRSHSDAETLSPRSAAQSQPESHPDSEARLEPSRVFFICYRRDDTQDAAGRLYDRLVHSFDSSRIFMDIDSVPLGIDFVDHVREQIARCSAVIVMIGKQWLTIKDKRRRRRLDDPDDLVRTEIAAALQQKIPVIPVLVQNASMPSPEDLPDDIRLLARRNGIHLRPDLWKEGVERLLRELEPIMGRISGR